MVVQRSILNSDLKQLIETFFSEAKKFFSDSSLQSNTCKILRPLSQYIDQTLLKPEATIEQIEILCAGARAYDFRAVCIQPYYLSKSKELLRGTNVMPITVIGFPLGANNTATKVFETHNAIALGAKEIDMVINISALKSGEYDFVYQDIKDVVQAAQEIPVKVIIETAYLSQDEKIICAAIVQLTGARYIKTSTGFAPTHAQIDDIKLFKYLLDGKTKIKASGGIKTLEQAQAFIGAGADRLGTSSGVEILTHGSVDSKDGY